MGGKRKKIVTTPAPKAVQTPKKVTPVATVAQGVGVSIYVVQKSNGQGNEKWLNTAFQKRLFDRVNALANLPGHKLYPSSIIPILDDANFNDRLQNDLIVAYNSKRIYRQLVVIFSGEETDDSAGLSFTGYTQFPYFIMRSRYNGSASDMDEAIDDNARIFLHELGHNMGLSHSDGSNAVHTDNFFDVADGRTQLTAYLAMLIHTPYIGDNSKSTNSRAIASVPFESKPMKVLPDKKSVVMKTKELIKKYNAR